MTPAEAHKTLVEDIKAHLRLTRELADDEALREEAKAMLERVEHQEPINPAKT